MTQKYIKNRNQQYIKKNSVSAINLEYIHYKKIEINIYI